LVSTISIILFPPIIFMKRLYSQTSMNFPNKNFIIYGKPSKEFKIHNGFRYVIPYVKKNFKYLKKKIGTLPRRILQRKMV
jgi:hypothetical protein